MAVPRKLTLTAVVALVLLFLGALASFWSVAWWIDRSYGVHITTAEQVSWTLWVPHPSVAITWTSEGAVQVAGSVDTQYGLRLNITGSGSARVRFFLSSIEIGERPSPVGQGLNLSGREGGPWPSRYHVWRQSSDPNANITLTGGLSLQGHRLGEDWQCGGPRYSGFPSEGWSGIPESFWDCVGGIQSFAFPGLIPAALFVPGTFLAVVEIRRRHRS